MTMVVEPQRNDNASSRSPAGLGDPLAIRRRPSCREASSHSQPHHRHVLRARLSKNTSPAGAITSSPAPDHVPKDAMRRTKAASVFLHSPSSHRDVRRLANV